MKITIDNSDQKSFEKLSPGDTFWFAESLYLKIHTCNGMNAINLTSNHLSFFQAKWYIKSNVN